MFFFVSIFSLFLFDFQKIGTILVSSSSFLKSPDETSDLIEFNFDFLDVPSIETIDRTLRILINDYWEKVQINGFGLAQIDDLLVLFIFVRLLILLTRFNTLTAFVITAISMGAAYVWYLHFIKTMFLYEETLYRNALTFSLGVDAAQMRAIILAKVQDSNYKIRITNPIGILFYAITNGAIFEGHRIDPISMVMTILPERIRYVSHYVYYFTWIKLVPLGYAVFKTVIGLFSSFIPYTYLTRVNKRICPYLIRWHWTYLIMISFLEPFYSYFSSRLVGYANLIVYPKILEAKQYNLYLPLKELEVQLLINFSFLLTLAHLVFILYAMFHAIAGQYFFIPFFTKNVELHVGLRSPSSIYSGGNTAWQDRNEQAKFKFPPKLWYGWFGRGTTTPSFISNIVTRLIYRPIYRMIRKILRFFRIK